MNASPAWSVTICTAPAASRQSSTAASATISAPERDDFARAAFGSPEKLPIDDNGRIILPPTLKEVGSIGPHAFFVAAGDYFEVWNPELFLETKGEANPLGRIVRRQLDARK